MGDPAIGQRIRQARLDARLTQSELALRVGLAHPQSISNYERGVDEADTDRLRQIAEATKKPLAFFLDEPPAPVVDTEALSERLTEQYDEIIARLGRIEEIARAGAIAAASLIDPR